ncbi:hypothetical protein [Butyrivibrio sp. NC3005]|uniref:hypothetical protein n=1 Tax=Butyrivibrio sp. NC3005 TaxID=1280685 RepID=UPI00041E46B6|nr:hypothetical protein [Butyrivibrio sp. NC3005]
MKEKIKCILALSFVVVLLASCKKDAATVLYSTSLNFDKEEYEEKYSHYEKILPNDNTFDIIRVKGNTSSGSINVKIMSDKNDKYTFTISGTLNEVISVPEKYDNAKWTVYVDIDKETDGEVTISLENT